MGLSGFRYLGLMRKGRGGSGGGGRKGKREEVEEEEGRERGEEVEEEEGSVRMGFSYNHSGPPRRVEGGG